MTPIKRTKERNTQTNIQTKTTDATIYFILKILFADLVIILCAHEQYLNIFSFSLKSIKKKLRSQNFYERRFAFLQYPIAVITTNGSISCRKETMTYKRVFC